VGREKAKTKIAENEVWAGWDTKAIVLHVVKKKIIEESLETFLGKISSSEGGTDKR